ncbi:MAG: hypothetical protein IKU20_08915 [Lachnospiraceae bacterium]|nr:hypothetical protein [Lachnospiraceae bacterium]
MIGEIFTAALGWAEEVVTFVGGSPLVLFFMCLPLIGLGIGIVRRLIRM